MSRRLSLHTESWTSKIPFRITGREWNDFPTVVCEIEQSDRIGRGEAMGVYYQGETTSSITEAIESIASQIESGIGRDELQSLLPPGGARNAVDCALWDLESRLTGESAWDKAGTRPNPIQTVLTIGLEPEPHQMANKALAAAEHGLFKVKLNDDRPVERIEAIRAARPEVRLVVDANQGWTIDQLRDVAPEMKRLGVEFVEQPLPRGGDESLGEYRAPLPLCGDESCLHRGELATAATRYQMINIKLDKTGGLTEALALASEARALGLRLMVGCMGGTSLAMAPAHVLAQQCDFVDIDGPLLLKRDRLGGLKYQGGVVEVPTNGFWGC